MKCFQLIAISSTLAGTAKQAAMQKVAAERGMTTTQVGFPPLFLRFSIENAEVPPFFVHLNKK